MKKNLCKGPVAAGYVVPLRRLEKAPVAGEKGVNEKNE